MNMCKIELFDYIKSLNVKCKVKNNNCYVVEKNIAFEYCNLQQNSENVISDRKHLFNKHLSCNYKTIFIFQDEWFNKMKIVKLRIKHILGKSNKHIFARKCHIFEIKPSIARYFINEHHIQGYTGSSIKLGAYYNHRMVAVMTFSKPSISKGRKNIKNVYELSRFCTSDHVIGIAGKFLKHFQRNYKWNIIYSYADKRWSDGNVYNKIGFKFIRETPVNYYYFKPNEMKRYHRFNFRKNTLNKKLKHFDKNKTEWVNMINNGWYRIWDCGNLLFEMENNENMLG